VPKWLLDEEALTLPSEKKLLQGKPIIAPEATPPTNSVNPQSNNNPGEIMLSEIKCETEIDIPLEGKDDFDIADSRVLAQKGEGLKEAGQ